jgi:PKD repeat protein
LSKPPPNILYPRKYDSDETLFLVYNTSESILVKDNPPWSETIEIKPSSQELWANNGFANINGELFYYNSTELIFDPEINTAVSLNTSGVFVKENHNLINGNAVKFQSMLDVFLTGKIYYVVESTQNTFKLSALKNGSAINPANSVNVSVVLIFGRVCKFKECVRNLGGQETKLNYAGVKVRGFVVAEHHNQIVDAIISLENFIGYNFTDDQTTLDWKIRNLNALPNIFDDHACPSVNFVFDIIENNPTTGIIAQYFITIDNSTASTNFRLDFGDGQYTTTEYQGTHTYSIGSNYDPALSVFNDNCSITLTPTERLTPLEPIKQTITDGLDIPVPPPPIIPPILITPFQVSPNKYNIPPIVFPCLDIAQNSPIGNINIPSKIEIVPPLKIPSLINITPINIPGKISITPINIPGQVEIVVPVPFNIPSRIEITPINIPGRIAIDPVQVEITSSGNVIPSNITITPINIPSRIVVDAISIDINTSGARIPSNITFSPVNITVTDTIPNTITVNSPLIYLPPEVNVYVSGNPIPNTITIDTSGLNLPNIYIAPPDFAIPINWGPIPELKATVTVECPTGSSSGGGTSMIKPYGMPDDNIMEIQVGDIGIPSVINVVAPKFPDIKVDASEIPSSIKIERIEGISEIRIIPPIMPIPSEIRIINDTRIPSSILLDASELPKSIPIVNLDIPESIGLKLIGDFPSEIKLNAEGIPDTIQVVGIPPVIELKGTIPDTIQLVMPEKPEIEMVYKGAPIDVKIQLDISKITGEGDKVNCVSIVPCK